MVVGPIAENVDELPAPVLSFVRSMAETAGKWELHGDYSIWSGGRSAGTSPYLLHELCDKGVVPIRRPTTRPVMHRIPAGTAFEVMPLFGFWISVDVDTVWLDAANPEGQYCALMVGGTKGKPAEASCAWVCPKCAALFARDSFAIPRQRFERFLEFAQTRVREFNVDAKLRTCPKCSAVHPPSYGFFAAQDTSEEHAARVAE